MKKLTIISHTEHYRDQDGTILGLGSTVTEINNLLEIFDEIVHVAMFHKETPPSSSLPYTSENITFIPIPAMGGTSFSEKLKVLFKMPSVLMVVRSAISDSDYFQFRAPTGIGMYVIPYLVWFSSKKGWFKYAGNWNQKQAPLAYRFQRWMLIHQKRKVTINGFWEDQPSQCLSFENPCLTHKEVETGNEICRTKTLIPGKIDLCFVGRVEVEKGVGLFIDALNALSEADRGQINLVHIVGDGHKAKAYMDQADKSKINFLFHGMLSRSEVHKVYERSHFMVLPSASEGFPKVISEATNYGCVPVVSDVSSISHYIKHETNGFLIVPLNKEGLRLQLINVLNIKKEKYQDIVQSGRDGIHRFTYAYYNNRLKQEVLN